MDTQEPQADADADDADAQVQEDARRSLATAAVGGPWWKEFADPPARIHTQTNLLSESKADGGSRNKRQRLFLEWLRALSTAKEAETRRPNGTYTAEWTRGDFGSPYSIFWPRGALANSSSVTLEHILPSEWMRAGEVVREAGYSRQDVTVTTMPNASENSMRGEKPLSVFGVAADAQNPRLFTPPESSELKKTRLALATCHGILTNPLVGQETKASGSKRFAGWVPEYARRYCVCSNARWHDAATCAGESPWCSPCITSGATLVFRPSMLRQPRYKALLGMRLQGGRNGRPDAARVRAGHTRRPGASARRRSADVD